MKKELIDPILDGYAAIIRDLLDSDDRLRFERITRIAKLAHALHQQTATRIGEIALGHEAGLVHYAEEEMQYATGGGGLFGEGRILHQNDVIREIIGAFHPVIRIFVEREQETRLNKLFDLRDRLREANDDTTVIDVRIVQLINNMKEKDNADPSMVHPELLRGHSSGADWSRELQSDRGEPEHPGNGSAEPAAQDSHEEGLDRCNGEAGLERDDEDRGAC